MIHYFEALLFLILFGTALAVFFTKKNLTAIIIYTTFSLVMSIVWMIIKSPDLAITEAAVGAGITSILFFVTLSSVGELKEFENVDFDRKPEKKNSKIFNAVGLSVTLVIIILLLNTVSNLPTFGDISNPVFNEVYTRYVEMGVEDTGALNLVAGVILDYRAFDTFGEAIMIFTALVGLLMLLKRDEEKSL